MKNNRRKTCECCGDRLTAAEDYWCRDCHGRIRAIYLDTKAHLQTLTDVGLSPEDAVRKVLDDMTGGRQCH